MAGSLRVAWLLQAGLLLLAWPAAAQVRLGEISSDLNGTISSGYTADLREYDRFRPRLDGRRRPPLFPALSTTRIFYPLMRSLLSESIAGKFQLPVHLRMPAGSTSPATSSAAATFPVRSAIPRLTTAKETTLFRVSPIT